MYLRAVRDFMAVQRVWARKAVRMSDALKRVAGDVGHARHGSLVLLVEKVVAQVVVERDFVLPAGAYHRTARDTAGRIGARGGGLPMVAQQVVVEELRLEERLHPGAQGTVGVEGEVHLDLEVGQVALLGELRPRGASRRLPGRRSSAGRR